MLQIETVLSSMWPLKVPKERPFWVSNFPFRDLFGLGNLASIFLGCLDFRDLYRCSKQSEDQRSSKWKSGCYFLGVHFWSRDFFEFCLKPYRFLWVLIYAPLWSSHHFTSRETSRASSLQFFVNYDTNYPLMFQTEYDSLKLHCQTLEAEHERNNQTQVSEVKPNFSVYSCPLKWLISCIAWLLFFFSL